jgi:hypothetical protein
MENEEIQRLRGTWGEKPCDHPALETMEATNDQVCTNCGRVVYSGRLVKNKKNTQGK